MHFEQHPLKDLQTPVLNITYCCDFFLQDSLADLLLQPSVGKTNRIVQELPKLEIKKDPKGMVTVVGATVVPVKSGKQLMQVGIGCRSYILHMKACAWIAIC